MAIHNMASSKPPGERRLAETSVYSELMAIAHDGKILFLRSDVEEKLALYCLVEPYNFDDFEIVRFDRGRSTLIKQKRRMPETPKLDVDFLKFETLDPHRIRIDCCLSARRDQPDLDPFREHAVRLINQAYRNFETVRFSCLLEPYQVEELAERITKCFEADLLFDTCQPQFEEWHKTGRKMFLEKLYICIRRGKPIEMALPAFPCKTSNSEKAASSKPDGADSLALEYLYLWSLKVSSLYGPGCFIDIISDGHVFSDCIGVDDYVVDKYNYTLQTMLIGLQAKYNPCGNWRSGVRFFNLGQLLTGVHLYWDVPIVHEAALESYVALATIIGTNTVRHPVRTLTAETNEIQRVILLKLASPPAEYLQDVIKGHPEHPLNKLFCGFSRFMLQDLAFHPDYKDVSVSQRKKAAEKVALEMILRNQSYSRLVEMVMPGHIRLSIHAHNNAGPKFAIRTLPKHVRYAEKAEDLINAAMSKPSVEKDSARATLHIPTPWHNVLVEAGTELFICKVVVAEIALKSEDVTGKYESDHVQGGRYVLKHDEKW